MRGPRVYRPEHEPLGDPCLVLVPGGDGRTCDVAAADHRFRRRPSRAGPPREPRPPKAPRPPKPPKPEKPFDPGTRNQETIVAIDGEGQGRHLARCECSLDVPDMECAECGHGPHALGACKVQIPTGDTHRYTYLAAVDEHGVTRGELRNARGIRTEDALDWFLDLGVSRVFGFSIGYDLTKILADLSDTKLFLLNRPDARRVRDPKTGRVEIQPVDWRHFRLSYLRGQLIVKRIHWSKKHGKNIVQGPGVIVWDVWRFFQSAFVTTLLDWKVASKEKLERMIRMKADRAHFDKLSKADIEAYCLEECHYLGMLVRALIEAHEQCELKLTNFFGAGSTATALLNKLHIKGYLPPPRGHKSYKAYAPKMQEALACGFFGGRFEVSHVGPISGPVYNYDISSAYPFHISQLPCLACGRWERAPKNKDLRARIDSSTLAVIRTTVRRAKDQPEAWGPLPWRGKDGSIVFPAETKSTWVWKNEFFAAERIFPGVQALEAWVYNTTCSHRPFQTLPEIYRERVRIGKEGKGIVLKLGPNSIYGKTAQSKGSARFQNFAWAGVITSNTRAQLLGAFEAAGNPDEWWRLLMFATDGIFSTKRLVMPEPLDTGTGAIAGPCDCKDKLHPKDHGVGEPHIVRKPLGGWEEKVYEKGVFLLRPGIYFPLQMTAEDAKSVKARGMSRGALFDNASRIEKHFEEHGTEVPYTVEGAFMKNETSGKVECVGGLQRFVGMTSGVLQHGLERSVGKNPPKRREDFGEWVDYPIVASFSPLPKRKRVLPENRLEMFRGFAEASGPYKKATVSPEAKLLQESEDIFRDQPEGDFTEVR